MTPGRLLREARIRHGLSQERLAIRAGTTQSAISRIEKDRVSPTVQTLAELLHLLGEDLVLSTEPRNWGVDVTLNQANLEMTPEDRVRQGLAFADFVRRNRGGRKAGPGGLSMVMAPSSASDPPLQLQRLLETLVRHGVDFVVIGGIAGLAHGSAYPTFDLDVAYAREHSNLKRLVRALRELEVTLRGAPKDLPVQLDERTLENGANFTFDSPFGKFDVLGDVDGSGGYERLRADSALKRLEGVEVRVTSIDRLIQMKRAANRPKDRNMLEEYIVLADEKQSKD